MTAAFLAFLATAISGQGQPAIDEILARVQTNTGQFVQSLPDFVCDERVTSKAVRRGKQLEVVIESHFVGLQKRAGRNSYTETREVVSINGEPAKKGQKTRGPFLFGGGFSSILEITFSARSIPSHTYKIAADEIVRGKQVIVVEFATREDQKDLYFDSFGKTRLQHDVGKAWLDKDSLQVLRLERHYLNVGEGQSPLISMVEYSNVRIGDKTFWMPSTVTATQSDSKKTSQAEYRAVYTNYRKFEVSSGIVF